MNIDKLVELDRQVMECKACVLCKNQHCTPFWSHDSKYVLLYESNPALDVTKHNVLLWSTLNQYGFLRDDFLVLPTVLCKMGLSKRNRKPVSPAMSHREECRQWTNSYINEVKPKAMLTIGNIAMEHVVGIFDGITQKNAHVHRKKICGNIIPIVTSVAPNFNPEMFKKSVEILSTVI